jgi:hypothetical protein
MNAIVRSYADAHYGGKFTRLELRFRSMFCYIDAYIEPMEPTASLLLALQVKWTPLSRQFIIEFKRVLSLLQLTGAVPILLNKLLLLRRRHFDIPSCLPRRNVVKV